MNPKADTHAVRVFEIQSVIRLVRPDPIDAVVTTTLLQSGATTVWRDSVIQLTNSNVRHVYWAAFDATAGETYRLDVVRSDGATSSAVTTVPPPVTLEVLAWDSTLARGALQPLFIRGQAPALPRIDVEYLVAGIHPAGGTAVFRSVVVNYAGRTTRQADGWLLEIDLLDDFRTIFQIIDQDEEVSAELIVLREMVVRVHVGDEQWISPAGVFDAEVLVEPGTFTNVDNGFGFFGSGYVEEIRFMPTGALLDRAGFD